jgi:putative endonuclease
MIVIPANASTSSAQVQESHKEGFWMKKYYVYMMSNKYNTTLYIGVTNNLKRRVYEHREKLIKGFSSKYNCNKLVWYEETGNIESAILKEKRMKKWKREYKESLIREKNPEWLDLYETIV